MKALPTLLITLLSLALLAGCGGAPADNTTVAEATSTPAATESSANESTGDPGDLPTGQHTYVIVSEESTASYHVAEEFFGLALGKYGIPEGLVETVGTTSAIQGQLELNWDDLAAPLGENTFTVDLSTLKSNQSLRDGWLRDNGPKFATYPDAIFVGESLTDTPTSYTPGDEVTFKMVGQMTVHEVTQPATFEITAKLANGIVTGVAVADLTMTGFGITPPDSRSATTFKSRSSLPQAPNKTIGKL